MEWNFDIQTASCQFQQYTMAFVTWRKEFVCIICECGLINVWLQLERRLLWESTAVVSSQKTHSNNKPKNHSKLKHYSPTITEEVSRPPQRTRQFLPATTTSTSSSSVILLKNTAATAAPYSFIFTNIDGWNNNNIVYTIQIWPSSRAWSKCAGPSLWCSYSKWCQVGSNISFIMSALPLYFFLVLQQYKANSVLLEGQGKRINRKLGKRGKYYY